MDKEIKQALAAKDRRALESIKNLEHSPYWLEQNTEARLQKITLIDRDGEWLLILTADSSEGPQIAFISAETPISALSKLSDQIKHKRLKLKLDENKIKWLSQEREPV